MIDEDLQKFSESRVMRTIAIERTYGRRSHHLPPPMAPPPQEDPRSRRSRTKMKCLISIGLILPALAAVIGNPLKQRFPTFVGVRTTCCVKSIYRPID
ncbi:hypothetical protein AVEN_89808-1 [Araneus ventricosus]|uniref:Uncharacterized protein n=1 Tax=Araneus ventricosus TaxID=182803 RepID=A0A4Y2JKU9_ARAVE|nr:hypothetical protein AVEN_89808-1 [Araneus ventricosus]